MPRALLPREELRRIIRHRKETGAYRWDEVWNGVYVVSPDPDIQHQDLMLDFAIALKNAIGGQHGVRVLPSVNLSDRREHWTKNYRCPDASVFLPGNPAQDKGTHWFGGPDFAVEILSPGDRARRKLPFYGKVGVRELLMIDRQPWRLELHRREGRRWVLVGTSTVEDPNPLTSEVLPLTFRLLPGDSRPVIEVVRADQAHWIV